MITSNGKEIGAMNQIFGQKKLERLCMNNVMATIHSVCHYKIIKDASH